MVLVPCELPKKKGYKKTKIQRLLEEFMAMETPCARVDCSEYKTVYTARCSIAAAIKRCRMNTIHPAVRGDAVYLIREDMAKEVHFK